MIKHLRERSCSEIEITNEEEFCVRLVGLCHALGQKLLLFVIFIIFNISELL